MRDTSGPARTLDREQSSRAQVEQGERRTNRGFHRSRVDSDPRPFEGQLVGEAWRAISETLHGRGVAGPAVRWEVFDLAAGAPPPNAVAALIRAAHVVCLQISVCLADVAHRRGSGELFCAAIYATESRSWPVPVPKPWLGDALLPLSVEVVATRYEAIDRDARMYGLLLSTAARQALTAAPLPPGSPALAFASRRSRHAHVARQQFAIEQSHYGDEWNPRGTPEPAAVMVSEMAGLAGGWSSNGIGHELLVASSALRSALWLWLDDDDRSLTLLRTCLEATAQHRTRRVDPVQFARLLGNPKVSVAQWTKAAGWPHLGTLAGALGEFSHVSERTRWRGARGALVSHAADREHPAQEARRNVLEIMIALLGDETAETLDGHSPELANVWREAKGQSGLGNPTKLLAEVGERLAALSFGPTDADLAGEPSADWAQQYAAVAKSRAGLS
jgi:hypothetical protein